MEFQREDGKLFLFRTDEDVDGEEITLPTKKGVCWDCGGKGKTLVAGLRGDVTEMINEDPDFADGYWGGRYDETCHTCRGQNVVDDIDYDALEPGMREALFKLQEQEDADRRETAHEIAMGY